MRSLDIVWVWPRGARQINKTMVFIHSLGINRVLPPKRPDLRKVLERPNNLGDLPDVADIVKSPLIKQVRYGDRAQLGMPRRAIHNVFRQLAQIIQIRLALLFEMIEGILGAAAGILTGGEVSFLIVRLERGIIVLD